jgi:hypothetical protein
MVLSGFAILFNKEQLISFINGNLCFVFNESH